MTTIYASGSSTIFIEANGSDIQYSIDSGSPTTIAAWPVSIVNISGVDYLKVIFRSDITLTDASQYFMCGSEYIQFGDTSLRPNGERAKITIDGVTDYPGLIWNGFYDVNIGTETQGYSNIHIFNIAVLSINTATLVINGGWIGQLAFANGAINNAIINCYSDGAISTDGGGIVGNSAGKSYSGNPYIAANLSIIGCNSTGTIAQNGGGITGALFGASGTDGVYSVCSVNESFSSGEISDYGGGIIGQAPGAVGSPPTKDVTISKCYSTGAVSGTNAGGIVGYSALTSLVEKSYSNGAITGGGIFGGAAGNVSTEPLASNCYSTGNISGGGIFGIDIDTYALAENCYTSGASSVIPFGGIFAGSSSDTDDGVGNNHGVNNYAEANNGNAGVWNTINANTALLEVPSISTPVGVTWALDPANLLHAPYILSSFGYTPYSVANIDMTNPSAPTLVKTYSQTILAGGSTISAVITAGHTFYILAINGAVPSSYPTITVNASTGAITAAPGAAIGIYNIVVYDKINPYTTTRVILTLAAPPPTGPCCVPIYALRGLTADDIASYRVGNRLIVDRATNPRMRFPSYEEYMKYKIALASAKR